MYKTKYLQATHCLLHFRVLHVSINKKIFPFFCNNRKNLSQHEIQNKKKTFMVFDMSYFKLRHSQSHDLSRSILHRQNYLMDYNTDCKPSKILAC